MDNDALSTEAADKRSGQPTLYHAMYKTPEGDALLPTCERTENGVEGAYLYATPYLAKALAFAFSYHSGQEIIQNGPCPDPREEYCIVINRDRTMAAPRPVRVYAFSSEGFVPTDDERQFVSTEKVPFSKTTIAFETDNVEDLMRQGLQIFSLPESLEELQAEGGFEEKYLNGLSTRETLFRLLNDGRARWENWERGIGVSADIQKSFDEMRNSNALLDRLVSQTNAILARSWEREQPSLSRKFAGYCGLAQCVAGYALQDIKADVRPVALQSVPSWYHGHAALTVHLDSRLFLVDPTFSQFCGAPVIDGAPSPESRLLQTPEGAALAKELLEHGYAELTPARARLYVAAFCNNGPYLNESEAWQFLSNPPAHPYYYHHEPNDNLFDRDVLGAKGLLIKDFAP